MQQIQMTVVGRYGPGWFDQLTDVAVRAWMTGQFRSHAFLVVGRDLLGPFPVVAGYPLGDQLRSNRDVQSVASRLAEMAVDHRSGQVILQYQQNVTVAVLVDGRPESRRVPCLKCVLVRRNRPELVQLWWRQNPEQAAMTLGTDLFQWSAIFCEDVIN